MSILMSTNTYITESMSDGSMGAVGENLHVKQGNGMLVI